MGRGGGRGAPVSPQSHSAHPSECWFLRPNTPSPKMTLLERITALKSNTTLLLLGGGALTCVLSSYALDWYLHREGKLSPAQAAVYGALPSDSQVSRVRLSSLSSASATLAHSFSDNSMIREISDARFTPERLLEASKRLCRVLLRTILPGSHGAVVLGTPGEGAVAVWLPSGA